MPVLVCPSWNPGHLLSYLLVLWTQRRSAGVCETSSVRATVTPRKEGVLKTFLMIVCLLHDLNICEESRRKCKSLGFFPVIPLDTFKAIVEIFILPFFRKHILEGHSIQSFMLEVWGWHWN